jgi:type IV secretion system protein VirB2
MRSFFHGVFEFSEDINFTTKNVFYLMWIALLLMLFLGPLSAFASQAGAGLPWEGPLANFRSSITGPVAYSISLIAIVVAGGVLIFQGGELGGFARTMISLILVIAIVVGAQNTLSTFFGVGAEITGAQIF